MLKLVARQALRFLPVPVVLKLLSLMATAEVDKIIMIDKKTIGKTIEVIIHSKIGIGEIIDPIPAAFKDFLLLPDLC